MRSIKPGRGPSFMDGIVSIFSCIFGIIWTVFAFSMGAGPIALFGFVFIAIAVVNAVYSFKNATSKRRYSAFDITEDGEEEDPLNARFGGRANTQHKRGVGKYCPYCGTKVADDFAYCNSCGKKLP